MILAVDIGTTSMKMGLFLRGEKGLDLVRQFSRSYKVNIYNNGSYGDIEQEKWRTAFFEGCRMMRDLLGDVEVISLSGTTPGLTAMDEKGNALYPAILMLDRRSYVQAHRIIEIIGMENLLAVTGNMPVAGGCSLASILWLKEHEPQIYAKTALFGHSNTWFGGWLTGNYAIDPSSASLTALYNTVKNDYAWNTEIAGVFGISLDQLPPVIPASHTIGRVSGELSEKLGLTREPYVLIGGNDAVLAAWSAGINEPGEVINVNGTSEITLICLDRCLASPNYNVRVHVLPRRWLTLHVMNAGGTALEWFREVFCMDMNQRDYYERFLPTSVEEWLEKESSVQYVPYLLGSRYSLNPLKAEFKGLTRQTSRSEMLAAMVKGLYGYQGQHIQEIVNQGVAVRDEIILTGGAVSDILIQTKKKWMWESRYVLQEQSSLRGAAMLGEKFLEG